MQKTEPIPVRRLRFVDERQDGLGLGSSTTCVTQAENAQKRHRAWFVPWLRAFWIEYDNGSSTETGFVPESRVMFWAPVEPPPMPIQLKQK